jgi:CheY-like chemotaxis protein
MDGASIEAASEADPRWSTFAARCLSTLVDPHDEGDVVRVLAAGVVDAFGGACALDVTHPFAGARRVTASADGTAHPTTAPFSSAPPATVGIVDALKAARALGDAGACGAIVARLSDGEVELGILWIAPRVGTNAERDLALADRIARAASRAIARVRTEEASERSAHRREEIDALVEHELGSPLRAMLGWAHLLRSDARGERARRGVDAIERGGTAMTRVIEDWREASELLLGSVVLERAVVRVDTLMRAIVEARRVAARRVPVTLRVEPGCDGRAYVDAARVRELFERMLDRIERTTPDGSAIVASLGARGDALMLSVENESSEHEAPRTSRPERVEDRTLTLAVVRGLAELHGGSAGAERDESRNGARIWALLPRGTAATARETPIDDLRGVNVLLVDDAPDSLELAATIVRLRGAHAAVASSSSEAIALLQEVPVDVLVSDIAMPHEDGCSLIRRALALRPGLRAAALSAHSHFEDRERALAAGFETYLTKPIDPETLARAVRSLAHPTPARAP